MFHLKYDNVIGVDVASRKLDLHDLQRQKHVVLENSPAAISQQIRRWTDTESRILVIMEATGGYEEQLLEALHAAQIDCTVVNPRRVRQFAQGCGMLEKNDKIDARVIAEYGAVVTPILKQPLSPQRRKLRALVHRRSQILSQTTAERNRIRQPCDEDIRQLVEASVKFYEQQLQVVDRQIAQAIEACQELADHNTILSSCPGVGPATISTLLAELPELGELSRGEIAKLVGVAPIIKDSGTQTGKRRTIGGRSQIRRVLYMAALVGTQHNPRFRAAYQALLKRGKPKKVALVAIMRKLLITLNTMIKKQQTWQDSTQQC